MNLGVLNETTVGHNTACEPNNVMVNTNDRNVKKVDKIIICNSREESVSRATRYDFFLKLNQLYWG